MADGRSICSSDADAVHVLETESSSLNPESCELEYLHLNDGKLVWMNDLESLKKFVENVLKLQGKWLTPGGNTKQFKCSNGNVIINWYNKKQQTLNFQGRDGPALKDRLIELIHKKPRKTTETQDANSLSSSEQSFQPSTLLQETDSGQSNFQTSTDGESLLNGSEKRPNSEIIADIEGLKLDLLILQKQVQENTKLLSMENIQKQDGNALGVELLDYKKKCEKLLSTISKKDNAINELEEKCLLLESRVLSLEQENDSLKLALTIITREKSEVENNQLQSSDRWSVAKPHPRSTNAKHRQKTMPTNIIQTRNGFEPLQVEDQIERNVSNQNGNSAVKGHRTSSSSSEIRTRNADLINSSNQLDHSQPNRQKKVIIAGDSTLKYLQSHKMSKNSQVKIATFPGCTTQDMKDHIKPLLRRNPDEIIIHVGTNSLRSSNTPRECAVELIDLADAVSSESSAMISISGLINRSDDEALACKVPDVNKVLKECCKQKNWGFVDHSNISITSHLNRSGLHLNKKGTTRLAQNFINHLRVD